MAILESVCGLRELALFAGAGGGILGGKLLDWRTVCAVECDAYAASILAQRQNDGALAPFPIWDDVRTFDGLPWRGLVDVVSGGFPCTDISAAGKGAGIEGKQSGLWSEMARIIGEVRPRFAFVENSPMLTSRGLGRVLGDLDEMGYNAEWGCISAADAIWLGSDPCLYHERERIWIVAEDADAWSRKGEQRRNTHVQRRWANKTEQTRMGGDATGNSDFTRLEIRQGEPGDDGAEQQAAERTSWWQSEPDVGRVVSRLAHRVDRLRAIGNGQVPLVAAIAFATLAARIGEDW